MTRLVRAGDVLDWHARAFVQKYSADQAAWVQRASGLADPPGALFQRYCAQPEDGVVESDGNLLVTTGLDAITKLLTGIGSPQAFSGPTRAIVGAGSSATAATIADTALGADGGNAWYQGCDAANPTQANGVMTAVATFGAGNANWTWAEWCWATCTGAITPGATLASVAAGTKLWNHKVQAFGTKGTGTVWVLTGTITIT